MCELLEQCWHSDPEERPMFLTIVKILNAISRISKFDKGEVKRGGGDNQPGCACSVM